MGVSALWVNLFFQTSLNYGHITTLGEGQGDCVIMAAKQVLRDRRVRVDCVLKIVHRLLL